MITTVYNNLAVEINGRHLLKRTQMADYAKYNFVTTYVNVFDSETMSPISMDFKRSDTVRLVARWTASSSYVSPGAPHAGLHADRDFAPTRGQT